MKLMSKLKTSKIAYSFLSLSVVLCISLAMIVSANTQSNERSQQFRSINRRTFNHEPVQIIKTLVNGREIPSLGSFKANDDWLNGFAIEVKNVSGQDITYLQIDLTVGGIYKTPIGLPLNFGSLKPKTPIARLKPGDTTMLKVQAENYAGLEHVINSDYFPSITNANMYINTVRFANNTGWATGHYLRPSDAKKDDWVIDDSIADNSQSTNPAGFIVKASLGQYLCKSRCLGQHTTNCCGNLRPDATYTYDPLAGEAIDTITVLCGPPNYDSCDYHLCAPCF